jgi:hypothetical protein
MYGVFRLLVDDAHVDTLLTQAERGHQSDRTGPYDENLSAC